MRRCIWYDFWQDMILIVGIISLILALSLGGCAFRYDKQAGGYAGAIGCVDVTGPGFSWKCVDGSNPKLPDSQKPPTP